MLEADPDNPANLYCAGLYEGEGTVGAYYRPGKSNNFQLKISMTDRQPLELFEDIMQVGKIYGPYNNRNNKLGSKPFYMYIVSNFDEIQYVMTSMWHWLSDRRKEQYENAVKVYESWKA